jgi:hypothetical protein
MGRVIKSVLRVAWAVAVVVFALCALFPVGTTTTRSCGLLALALIWLGLVAGLWKYRGWRWGVPAVSVAAAVFLLLPGRPFSREDLREKYLGCLRRYEGVAYVLGGENALGIDCSGLVRRGLMDALFLEGVRTFNPALVREAISLWWNDTTARGLGEGTGPTVATGVSAREINLLDHDTIPPGDLAVTESGVHVLAYLGDETWIEADPALESVITVKAPSRDNAWLAAPVKIVRWKILQP